MQLIIYIETLVKMYFFLSGNIKKIIFRANIFMQNFKLQEIKHYFKTNFKFLSDKICI